MEKSGKKFFAVRVQYDDHDIVLENPVAIDPLRHMNNRRFAAEPTVVGDDEASALLDDIIRDNPDKQPAAGEDAQSDQSDPSREQGGEPIDVAEQAERLA